MAFADSLKRLREAVDRRRAGYPGDFCTIKKSDLTDLLFHFDRLDAEARQEMNGIFCPHCGQRHPPDGMCV